MRIKLKQLLCGATHHNNFRDIVIDCKIDHDKNEIIVTQTCCNCKKQFTYVKEYESSEQNI